MLPNFVDPKHAVEFAVQQHFANVLRICRGSGDVHFLHETVTDLYVALERHQSEVGGPPADWEIAAAATAWKEGRGQVWADECREMMYSGALQIVASNLLGQRLQVSHGERQFTAGYEKPTR